MFKKLLKHVVVISLRGHQTWGTMRRCSWALACIRTTFRDNPHGRQKKQHPQIGAKYEKHSEESRSWMRIMSTAGPAKDKQNVITKERFRYYVISKPQQQHGDHPSDFRESFVY